MKKTLIATAIAAISFSGAAAAQVTLSASELAAMMDSMPQVYGNIQLAIVHDNVDGGPSNIKHADNGSTIGVRHDHLIAPGITGFFRAELEFDADDKASNGGLNAFDEAYIGVEGDSFGRAWIGSDDSTFETAIDEIANFFEVATLNQGGGYDTGEGDLVQYKTPSFGGLTLGAAVQFNGDGDARTGADARTSGNKSYPYQLSAVYAVDALELAVAMDSNDGSTKYSDNDASENNENTYGVRASYSMDSLRLTGLVKTRKDVSDVFGVLGAYTLGNNQFALAYEVKNLDGKSKDKANGEDSTSTITVQALRNVSDNLYVYIEGYLGGGDDVYGGVDAEKAKFGVPDKGAVAAYSDERTVAAIGATYYF